MNYPEEDSKWQIKVRSVIHILESGFCKGLTSAFMTRVKVELARKEFSC
jgi:hypothetical protein